MKTDIKKLIKYSNFSDENSNKETLLQKLLVKNRELNCKEEMKEKHRRR